MGRRTKPHLLPADFTQPAYCFVGYFLPRFPGRKRYLLSCYAHTDRAAHAGAAEAAVAHGVLGEILLMIVLGIVEGRRVEDLGGDRVAHAVLGERLLKHRLRGLGCLLLFRREGVDARAILR